MPVCEDLATKAELQELRDQLNTYLGAKEGGGNEEIFIAGSSTPASTILAGTTILGVGTALSQTAIQDIILEGTVSQAIEKDLASGAAQWTKVKGSGAKAPLPDLSKMGKVTGQTATVTAPAAAAPAAAASATTLLASLALIASAVGIFAATDRVLGQRIDTNEKAIQDWNKDYTSLINLISDNQNDIDVARQKLADNETAFVNQKNTNQDLLNQIADSNINIDNLETQLQAQQSLSQELTDTITQLQTTIAEIQHDNAELATSYQVTADKLTTQITSANEMIVNLQGNLTNMRLHVQILEQRVQSQDERITQLEVESTYWRSELLQLKQDFEENVELTDARITLLEAKVILAENKVRATGTGGSPAAVTTAVADTQTKVLDLTSSLTEANPETPTITDAHVLNGDSTFSDTFADLITQITTGGEVNQEQLDQLRTDLSSDFNAILLTGLTQNVTPDLTTIKEQTTQNALATGTEQGICNSLNNPTACPVTPENPNPTQGLKGMKDFLDAKAQQIANGLGLANLGANSTILGIVKDTNNVINNAQTGLKKTSEFVQTAWKATHADKVLTAINTGLLVHNAIMLSNNVAQTIGDTASVILDAVGIKDETDSPIDVNEFIRSKMNAFFTSILGAENYATVKERLAKANRIYQATANVANIIRDLTESARSITEMAASNTGKIGNALLEAGVVFDNAYDEMIEDVKPQSGWQRRFEQFREGLDVVEDGVSTVGNIASETVNVKEQFTELKEAKDNWQTEVNTTVNELKQERATNKDNSLVGTDINSIDFTRNESTN